MFHVEHSKAVDFAEKCSTWNNFGFHRQHYRDVITIRFLFHVKHFRRL